MTEAPPQYLQQIPSDALRILARTPSSEWQRVFQRAAPNDEGFVVDGIRVGFNMATGTSESLSPYKFVDCSAAEAMADPHGQVLAKLSIASAATGVSFEFVCMQYLNQNGEPWGRLWEMVADYQRDAVDVLFARDREET